MSTSSSSSDTQTISSHTASQTTTPQQTLSNPTPPTQLIQTQTQIPAGYQLATQFHPATPEYAVSVRRDAARQGQYSGDQIETALCSWWLENISPELPAGVRMPEGLARSSFQDDRTRVFAAAAPASAGFHGPVAAASYAAALAPAVFQGPVAPASYYGEPAHAVVRGAQALDPSSIVTVVEERQPRRTTSNSGVPESYIARATQALAPNAGVPAHPVTRDNQALAPSAVLAVIGEPRAPRTTQCVNCRRFPLFEDTQAHAYGPGVLPRTSLEEPVALLQEEREFDDLMAWAIRQGELKRNEGMQE